MAMLGLLASLTLGCDNQEATAPPAPEDTTTSALDQVSDKAPHSIKDAGKDVAATLETTADKAAEQVAKVKDDVAAKIDDVKADLPDVDAVVAESQTLVDQAMGYIKDNKLDLAEKTLAKLDAMKASLPASIQSQIANAQKALDTAKSLSSGNATEALGGLKLPGTK